MEINSFDQTKIIRALVFDQTKIIRALVFDQTKIIRALVFDQTKIIRALVFDQTKIIRALVFAFTVTLNQIFAKKNYVLIDTLEFFISFSCFSFIGWKLKLGQ